MSGFVFDLTGMKKDKWIWKRIDDAGETIDACHGTFRFFLDCIEDAKHHGYTGPPLFPPRKVGPVVPRSGR